MCHASSLRARLRKIANFCRIICCGLIIFLNCFSCYTIHSHPHSDFSSRCMPARVKTPSLPCRIGMFFLVACARVKLLRRILTSCFRKVTIVAFVCTFYLFIVYHLVYVFLSPTHTVVLQFCCRGSSINWCRWFHFFFCCKFTFKSKWRETLTAA